MKNIHTEALFTFGIKERLRKLRTEATELAHAIDRYDEGKGDFAAILHEQRDVDFVWRSIECSQQCFEAVAINQWSAHEAESNRKLKQAISDMQHYVDDIAGDGDA
ncbi:MAG: hypothetical protein HGB02_03810 [Chlorobiaceae bacterium]|nr:hypothetical protein [Chlorobiaceae bacterium]